MTKIISYQRPKNIEEALPSMPVEILGMNDSVFAGAEFSVTEEEKAELAKAAAAGVSERAELKAKQGAIRDTAGLWDLSLIHI